MEDYRKIAIELGQTLISKAPETREDVERMLPELRESDDERIRKQLIKHTKWSYDEQEISEEEKERWISWLEKQGEQILANSAKTCKDEQKPAWSEEDEEELSDAIFFVREYQIPTRDKKLLEAAKKAEEWLKSLRPQNRWKPSDEQMVALKHAFNDGSIDFADMKILATLYEQLKALHRYEHGNNLIENCKDYQKD